MKEDEVTGMASWRSRPAAIVAAASIAIAGVAWSGCGGEDEADEAQEQLEDALNDVDLSEEDLQELSDDAQEQLENAQDLSEEELEQLQEEAQEAQEQLEDLDIGNN